MKEIATEEIRSCVYDLADTVEEARREMLTGNGYKMRDALIAAHSLLSETNIIIENWMSEERRRGNIK